MKRMTRFGVLAAIVLGTIATATPASACTNLGCAACRVTWNAVDKVTDPPFECPA